MFRGFERFSEVFQRTSQRPSQSAIFLSELRVVLPLIVLPLIVLPLKTPTSTAVLFGQVVGVGVSETLPINWGFPR